MKVLIAGGIFRHCDDEIASRQPTPEVTLARGLQERGIEVTTSPLENLWRLARPGKIDVTHVHHFSRAAVVSALAPNRTPTVFTPHSMASASTRRERVGRAMIMSRINAGVCLSEAERILRSAEYPKIAPRLRVIPNGIAPPRASATERTLDDAPLRLLFVGQLIPVKRIDRILKALPHCPRVELRLVFHNDSGLSELVGLATKLGIMSRVTFVGQLTGDDLFEEYQRAHALILASQSEALPSVITEALMTGAPVIATDVGGVKAQLGGSGILVPSAAEDLSGAILELSEKFDVYARRALLRAREVRREFSVDRMIEAHVALYEAVVSR